MALLPSCMINVGESITANLNGSSWQSRSGDFAFGFHQFNDNKNLFLLAIWYVKIPDTIVWYGSDGKPVPQGSSVKITAGEGLVLSDPQGTSLWNVTNDLSGSGSPIASGFMDDTGNFMLKSSSSSGDVVWQSFDHPTDTLLPTQTIKAETEVNSRRSVTNFTKGRFQLRLLSDGNLVLKSRELATGFTYGTYYQFGNNYTGALDGGDKTIVYESGRFYVHTKNGSRFDLTQPNNYTAKNYYQRVTLNFDGILTNYYHPRNILDNQTANWTMIVSYPNNICMKQTSYGEDLYGGACGYNSICSIDDNQRPRCRCPQGYVLMDPNDEYASCKPNFKLYTCDQEPRQGAARKDEYSMVPLPNTDWPYADYAWLEPTTEEECKSSCLNDCFCAAALFKETTCWKKKLPLTAGRSDSTVTRTAWLKVGNVNESNYPINPVIPSHTVKYKKNPVFSALFGGTVCVNFFLLGAIILGIFCMDRKKHYRCLDNRHMSGTLSEYNNVHSFSYKELHDATSGFKEVIGRGAFGTVYKGRIGAQKNPTTVAVKRLDRISTEADNEFTTEVNVIGQTHHKNLVRFIGFCKEADHRLLVYECMSNGTVADYLFGDLRPSWNERIQIGQGVARGLLYLHEECRTQIIHCDIKPQNILLDDYYNARISDVSLVVCQKNGHQSKRKSNTTSE